MLDVSPEDITEGPILRSLLLLAAPLVLQNLVLAVQQIVDLFWLGRFSADAVAALGLTYPLVALLYALALWAPMVGTQVVVSQRVGAEGNPQSAYTTGMVLALAVGAVVGAVSFLGAGPLVDLITGLRPGEVDGRVPTMAIRYFGVLALAVPLMGATEVVENGFVGWGDSRASLYMNLFSVVINVALDPLLIFGPGPFPALGVRGAALGTAVSSVVAGLIGLTLALAGRNDGMLPSGRAFDSGTAREILDVGAPTAAQNAVRHVAGLALVVLVFVAGGAPALAAYFVGLRVLGFAYIPAQGLQRALQSAVGQNLGAECAARARRATWLGTGVAIGALAVVGAAQWVLAGVLTDVVAPTLAGEARALAVAFLRVIAVGYPAVGAMYLFEGGFNGARRTRVSFVATLLQQWAFRIPLAAATVVLVGGVVAIFWVIVASNVAVALGLAAYYHHSVSEGMLDRAVGAAD